MKKLNYIILTVCLIALNACGYASKNDLAKVRLQAEEANTTANQALSESRQAKSLALAADDRTKQTEVVVNRSYKKSMYK